jgi:hypothetical protein
VLRPRSSVEPSPQHPENPPGKRFGPAFDVLQDVDQKLEGSPIALCRFRDRGNARGTESLQTPRWRRQSGANSSLKPEFPASREFTGNFIDSGLCGA